MRKSDAFSARLKLWAFTTVTCLFVSPITELSSRAEEFDAAPDEVFEEFVRVPGMRMTEYSFWRSNETKDECARNCLDETRIFCKSFSYSQSALACGIYENGRSDAPPSAYGPQIIPMDENDGEPLWEYFERKSEGYRLLENKMKALDNLTKISQDMASEILMGFTNSLTLDDEIQSSGDVIISSGELDLMSRMLRKIIELNPVVNATPEEAESFAQVLMNVSDAMLNPQHVAGWKALQKDVTNNGVAGIVTATEAAGRDISARLLRFRHASPITVDSSTVGMWFDIVHYPEVNTPPMLGFSNLAAELMARIARILSEHHEESSYRFPPEKESTQPHRRRTKSKTDAATAALIGNDVITLPTEALRNRSVVSHVRYKLLQKIISSQYLNDLHPAETTTYSIVSSVLTTSVHPKPPTTIFEKNPVVIVFRHDNQDDVDSLSLPTPNSLGISTETYSNLNQSLPNTETTLMCVFWRESEDSPGGWSEDGCELETSNLTHTACKCKHLTSFAVLLQMVDASADDPTMRFHNRALSYVSYIGCTLSLVGVTIMCAAFIMLKFHTENMKIHFNLGVAVGVADCIFIFEEFAQKERYSCVLVTILLYYTNMAVLSWMLIEGLFLYSQVVVVFVSARRWVRYYVFAGWGIPAIVMGIAMGILNVQLGKNRICWLSPADNSIWAFAVPAILVILVNFVILISVVRVIVGIQPTQGNGMKVARVKNAVKGSIFLSPLLGTTWLFGLLSLSEETVFFQYLFAVLNSLQGFFLFLFHCVCNSEVRADIARRRSRKPTAGGVFSGKSFSWFSGTFGFNVASGLRKFRNSISFDFANFSHSTSENTADKESKYTAKGCSTDKEVSLREDSAAEKSSPKSATKSKSEIIPSELKLESRSISRILEEHTAKHTLRMGKLPPLPLMPMKNDVIIAGRTNRVSPEDLNEILRKQNDGKAMFHSKSEPSDHFVSRASTEKSIQHQLSRIEQSDDPISPPASHCDDLSNTGEIPVKDEKQDENIAMSYDSGLNSIDNDSIFEGDDSYDDMSYKNYVFSANGVHVRAQAWEDD